MNAVYRALKKVACCLDELGRPYVVIGGLPADCRGKPRTTNVVDLSVWAEIGRESAAIDPVLQVFQARIPDAAEFARANRILVIQAANGVAIDLALAAFPFEEAMLLRATRVRLSRGLTVPVWTAEDVVVSKALAGREIDWFGIQGVLDRLGPKLDFAAVMTRLRELSELVDLDDVSTRLEQILHRSNDLDEPA